MADIFISYKKEDAGRVVRIVEGLRAEGFSVWWDHGITPGSQWDQTIQNELDAAKAVIAIWSDESVDAPWVKEEAGVGKNRGILLPIRIDDVDPPLGFSLIQMADLVGWNGDQSDKHWQQVLAALRAIIRGETPVGLEAAPRRKKGGALIAVLAAALVLGAGGFAAWHFMQPSAPAISAGDSPSGPGQTIPGTQVPSSPPAQAGPPSAQEQQAWDNAMGEKTRAAFQAYLVSFPSGAFAERARDILLTCRSETREVWNEQRTGQMIRGVDTDGRATQAQACEAANLNARGTMERACRAISANEGSRNGRINFIEGPCDCQETPNGHICTADPTYSCIWEMRSEQQVEICGG